MIPMTYMGLWGLFSFLGVTDDPASVLASDLGPLIKRMEPFSREIVVYRQLDAPLGTGSDGDPTWADDRALVAATLFVSERSPRERFNSRSDDFDRFDRSLRATGLIVRASGQPNTYRRYASSPG